MRLPRRIGGPLPRTHEHALRRALSTMSRQILATMPQVQTPADAKRLGVAVARAWSDAKIAALVKRAGVGAERASSAPWAKLPARRKPKRDAKASAPVVEYDGDALVEAWVRQATKLITSVRDEAIDRIASDVAAAHAAGHDPATLAAKWRREGIPLKWGTLEGRTQVIAQNQLSILHARVQSTRARAVGAGSFVWHTQGDSKVRPAHVALEGRTFEYAHPPSEGLPGEPINCRCWAETIVDDDVLAALGLDDVV